MKKEIIIKTNDENKRLDNFLAKCLNVPKSFIFKALRTKQIKVNNTKQLPSYKLKLNDVVNIFVNINQNNNNEEKLLFLKAKKLENIIYEDHNILIIFKPVGLIVHEDKYEKVDTLINRILKYLYDKKVYHPNNENSFIPSLAHRLDRNTAGLMVAAKTAKALNSLNELFKNHDIQKKYLALVHGDFKPNNIEYKCYLKKNENNIVTVYNHPYQDAKLAITKFNKIDFIKNKYSLIDINIITGRTHQIRASLNELKYPIVGDQKYTNKYVDKDQRFLCQALVAYYLKFNITNENDPLFYLNQKIIKTDNIWFLDIINERGKYGN